MLNLNCASFMKLKRKIKYVFLFILIIKCNNPFRVIEEGPKETQDAPKNQSLYIKNFRHTFINSKSMKVWELRGEHTYIYQSDTKGIPNIIKEAHTLAYNFEFEQFASETNKNSILKATRGEYRPEINLITLEGKVSYREENEKEVTGEKMQYDIQNKILTSEKEVLLKDLSRQSKGQTLCKGGIFIDIMKNKQVCKLPVIQALIR